LKTIPLAGSCYDLDILLANEVQIDRQSVNEVKDFFSEYRNL